MKTYAVEIEGTKVVVQQDNDGKFIIPDDWRGIGSALKPAVELVCMARKPLSERTIAANVLKWGTGAINVDGCRVPTDEIAEIGSPSWGGPMKRMSVVPGQEGKLVERKPPNNNGRWPANVIHDGSDEVVGAFPFSSSGTGAIKRETGAGHQANAYGKKSRPAGTPMICHGDEGSAARFFYTSKADADDRLGSKHPTVKPLDLMQYLVRLVTPKNGTVLDCFSGTGTTGEAAWREGMNAVLVEREAEYQNDIRCRMDLCLSGPDERQRESIKAKLKGKPVDHGPLFGGNE